MMVASSNSIYEKPPSLAYFKYKLKREESQYKILNCLSYLINVWLYLGVCMFSSYICIYGLEVFVR